MTYKDTLEDFCKGRVVAKFGDDVVHDSSNVITYRAADIMARVISGDGNYIPTHIGFIYGPTAATMQNPDGASPVRQHTLQDIADDVEAIGGNMLVSPIIGSPLFAVDGDTDYYEGNAVTITSISDGSSPLAFAGGSFATDRPQATTDKYFQAALLTRLLAPGSTTPLYKPFARVQLAAGNDGLVVQSGFELSVFWTITFK